NCLTSFWIIILLIGIFFISLQEARADNFAYTNGTYIYQNEVRQFYRGINYITALVWGNDFYGIPEAKDIQKIKEYNFNAIRLPLSTYQFRQNGVWNNTVLRWLNNTINWSKANNLSVILDLHGDNPTSAYVFKGFIEKNQSQWDNITYFWTYLASLYKNETTILGYDLINEPYFYKPIDSYTNKTAIDELWKEWVNFTYAGDFDKLNKSWNGVATFTKFDNETSYLNTTLGLMAYWKFDNNSEAGENKTYAYDWTGNGFDVYQSSSTSAPSFNLSGKINGNMDFRGPQSMNSIPFANHTLSQFSVAFWFKCIYNQPQYPRVFMAYRNRTQYAGIYLYLYPANGGVSRLYTWFLNSTGSLPTGLQNQVISRNPICNDTSDWRHVVYQYTGAQAQLYLDGVLDDSYNITTDVTNITHFRMGERNIRGNS
ncbi:MAG: cellulase family glycosylhydrolase, partial [Candidatus Pacearchaeota archaeon]|nr:cellulase family glycosylhydrolase [Candidatus Pacearchaeota archaeon]